MHGCRRSVRLNDVLGFQVLYDQSIADSIEDPPVRLVVLVGLSRMLLRCAHKGCSLVNETRLVHSISTALSFRRVSNPGPMRCLFRWAVIPTPSGRVIDRASTFIACLLKIQLFLRTH